MAMWAEIVCLSPLPGWPDWWRIRCFAVSGCSSREADRHQSQTSQRRSHRLNAEFKQQWQESHLASAPRADDLAIARRLSLALVGTVPSLEEIRALEAVPVKDRVAWWTNHLLEDRRFADYWAERLARIYVGNEQGNIVLFRRRRFAAVAGRQLAANTPYDEIVQRAPGRRRDLDRQAGDQFHHRDCQSWSRQSARSRASRRPHRAGVSRHADRLPAVPRRQARQHQRRLVPTTSQRHASQFS